MDCNPASRCCATAYLTGKGGFWGSIFEEIQMKDCKYSKRLNYCTKPLYGLRFVKMMAIFDIINATDLLLQNISRIPVVCLC